MHRFYIAPEHWNLAAPSLEGAEAHHAVDVLRVRQGDRIVIFNGRGAEATTEVVEADKRRLDLKVLHQAKSEPLACRITLAQAIPKGKTMDLIIQKATELGVSAIVPLVSERTVVQCSPEEAARKREKWQGVVIEAGKQCGRNWLPPVAEPVTPKAFFADSPRFDLMLIASLQSDALPPRKVLEEVQATLGGKPKEVLILIGPEGDFTPAEISLAKIAGCRPITLGPIVLRSETAALYTLSVLSYELFE
ncbi:MAG TPA: 16S rRNA (uracil(1498)-N(3))-methyltransferase [Chthoniobacteraceae bacterium]|nr:16S rRNA (uracil(1498)-N(3))-methyltransferase [Chthoniobacteraceae bacterium]